MLYPDNDFGSIFYCGINTLAFFTPRLNVIKLFRVIIYELLY
jgi:hypothetical protein